MKTDFDIIVIGAGSAGLGAALVPAKFGLKVLQIVKSDHQIGGDCLNEGCVPSKALIHISKIIHDAKKSTQLGLKINGEIDIQKVTSYIHDRQEIIRKHENAKWLAQQGIEVVLGLAKFHSKNSIAVNDKIYTGKYIVIATGSKPAKLKVKGAELVKTINNESIFHINQLPKRLLVVGAGPIGIELGQALSRLGSEVTFIQRGNRILPHDDAEVSEILLQQLKAEGIKFEMNAEVDHFLNETEALVKYKGGKTSTLSFDAVLVAVGRELVTDTLSLEKAGIKMENCKIKADKYLRTTNPKVYLAGDIAGSLMFSHAAEQHVRLIMNNFFSPFKKRLNNDNLSWVTFTDPQVATFGLNEKTLQERNINYKRLELDFKDDDRAVTDDYRYGKIVLFMRSGSFLSKKVLLGGSMVAPEAGEMVQELILANTAKLSVKKILNKIYPYPTASRVNQKILSEDLTSGLTDGIKTVLRFLFGKFVR
ncbi:MAG: NAD(P)/FAD-dependent oxidoreductase [Bacteroidetes bacterium]|nr:NAD(P)/FAD-dependent oxidoreductase [Bacteroidota bacterium]MBU1372679.1 NAD(P)/FAD-dependent oxidoreductase [Bacteroidota bacterium]MBU1484875.1 NAD(P)/FAD-dependent oxidoreductase [Bacteroidota bacterium]MBU1761560.1 NAD(P)/FAD-dependent oxidoreductase [Bacteroidota bacterium]MBU2046521.1 NAD(P)/FAD-dependent oxidoreductase [Bacteroidota bacterium]